MPTTRRLQERVLALDKLRRMRPRRCAIAAMVRAVGFGSGRSACRGSACAAWELGFGGRLAEVERQRVLGVADFRRNCDRTGRVAECEEAGDAAAFGFVG